MKIANYITSQPSFIFTLLCLLFLPISSIASSSVNDKISELPIKIRFSHVVTSDTPKGHLAQKFKDILKSKLGNNVVSVEIYESSTLFNDNELADALLRGDVEMGVPAISKLKKYSQRLQVLDLPFLFVSPEATENFLKGPYGDRLLRVVGRSGLKGHGFLSSGMKQLSAKTPIKTPNDLKGLKYRIMNSDVLESQFQEVGAVPVKKPFSKVYSSLASNEIDGQENTWISVYSKKLHEHQPFFIESNHGYLGCMVLTSDKFWRSIPKDIKPTIEQALSEALEHANYIAKTKALSDKEKILSAGVNLHTLTLEERKEWVAAMQPVWMKFSDQIGTELIQAAASSR